MQHSMQCVTCRGTSHARGACSSVADSFLHTLVAWYACWEMSGGDSCWRGPCTLPEVGSRAAWCLGATYKTLKGNMGACHAVPAAYAHARCFPATPTCVVALAQQVAHHKPTELLIINQQHVNCVWHSWHRRSVHAAVLAVVSRWGCGQQALLDTAATPSDCADAVGVTLSNISKHPSNRGGLGLRKQFRLSFVRPRVLCG